MSHDNYPEKDDKRREQKRTNQLTALFAGLGTGLGFALLLGLSLERWGFAIGLGVVVALAVGFGLNAIRKDSRKVVDDVPESEA